MLLMFTIICKHTRHFILHTAVICKDSWMGKTDGRFQLQWINENPSFSIISSCYWSRWKTLSKLLPCLYLERVAAPCNFFFWFHVVNIERAFLMLTFVLRHQNNRFSRSDCPTIKVRAVLGFPFFAWWIITGKSTSFNCDTGKKEIIDIHYLQYCLSPQLNSNYKQSLWLLQNIQHRRTSFLQCCVLISFSYL